MVHSRLHSDGSRKIAAQPLAALSRFSRLSLWRDSLSVGLILASLVGLAGLLVYVYAWVPNLPQLLPLHYNGSGSVDLIGPRIDLFKMPAIGAIVFGADLTLATILHRRERMAAWLLLTGSVLVQLMLIVATINIVRLAFGD